MRLHDAAESGSGIADAIHAVRAMGMQRAADVLRQLDLQHDTVAYDGEFRFACLQRGVFVGSRNSGGHVTDCVWLASLTRAGQRAGFFSWLGPKNSRITKLEMNPRGVMVAYVIAGTRESGTQYQYENADQNEYVIEWLPGQPPTSGLFPEDPLMGR